MAYVELEYKGLSFEENPYLITWVQMYLVKLLKSEEGSEWIDQIIYEWEMNMEIDIYKYLFDDDLLGSVERENWAIKFLTDAEANLNEMSIKDFGNFIGDDISEEVDFSRIKNIITEHKKMIEKSISSEL